MGLHAMAQGPAVFPASPYAAALLALSRSQVPFLVGGTYAFAHYTGISRPTKDLDLFVMREDRDWLLETLEGLGWTTEVAFPHWLAKARCGPSSIDVIHGAGNGIAMVDKEWFTHARPGPVLGVATRLTPPEE